MGKKVDIDKVKSLTPDELQLALALIDVAKDAREASELIIESYKFIAKEKNKVVYKDKDQGIEESYNRDGIWTRIHQGKKYTVDCSIEGIYDIFCAEYLIENKIANSLENDLPTEYEDKAKTAFYFREFVNRTLEDSILEQNEKSFKKTINDIPDEEILKMNEKP